MKHVNGPVCESCNQKLEDSHPKMKQWVLDLKTLYLDLHVSCTFRSKIDQDKAFLAKLSCLKWPNSKHNFMLNGKPYSLAVDLFQIDKDGKGLWNPQFFAHLDDQNEMQEEMRWGGTFKSLGDYCHFELKKP